MDLPSGLKKMKLEAKGPSGVKRMKQEAEDSLTVEKVVSLENIISSLRTLLLFYQMICWKCLFIAFYGKMGSKKHTDYIFLFFMVFNRSIYKFKDDFQK